jgi:hypothetical protein
MARPKQRFGRLTEEQGEKMIKRLKDASPEDLIPKEEVRIWVLRAYNEGYHQGYVSGCNLAQAAEKAKISVEQLKQQLKGRSFKHTLRRLAYRDRFLKSIAPDLEPNEDDINYKFTEEEMEQVNEK